MRLKSFMSTVVAIAALTLLSGFADSNSLTAQEQGRPGGQGQGRPGGQNLSPDEMKMAQAIRSAADPAAKLRAAAELIKKYPKTTVRPQVAHGLVDQIAGVTDASQKLTLAQDYQKIFDQPSEQELIIPLLINAYAAANQPDQAFAKGAEYLAHNPDSLPVLIDLMSIGTEQAKKQNGKFVAQSLQYGVHAIELIEADKKPAEMADAAWTQYKTSVLPQMYQSVGLLNIVKGNRAEAKARYEKASQLAPTDPFNYLMIAGILNEEYQNEAKLYQSQPESPAKTQELKKAQGMLDAVIDAYAHAVALAEGNASLQQVRQQYLQDLEAYYKYRHNGSTQGMQQLIDKYKTPAKP